MTNELIGEIVAEQILNGKVVAEQNLNGEVNAEQVLEGTVEFDIITIKGEDGKSPYINENGNWMYFDDKTKTWIESKNENYYTKKEVDNIIQETILDSWEEDI